MSDLEHSSIARVRKALESHGTQVEIRRLEESARTALEAANALGIAVGQIASSIVFRLVQDNREVPLLIVTSGKHRVDTDLIAAELATRNISGSIKRADADFVRTHSGFAIGGVSPVGWHSQSAAISPLVFVDEALSGFAEVWAAAGHTHAVFRTSAHELSQLTGSELIKVAND